MPGQSPSPPRAAIAVALTLLLFSACQESLPPAPSDLTVGLVVYDRANFRGESAHITHDISDLGDVVGPCEHLTFFDGEDWNTTYAWTDCISSVRVAPGWRATLYRDRDYQGTSLDITGDISDLQLVPGNCSSGGLTNCVSSVRVSSQ